MPTSPYELNRDRRIPKQKRKVANSAAYDARLLSGSGAGLFNASE